MRHFSLVLVAAATMSFACGDSGGGAPSASATASSAPPSKASAKASASAAALEVMPIITLDKGGVEFRGQRAALVDQDGFDKLKTMVPTLPIKGQEVTVIEEKGKFSYVSALVHELGAAGAPSVRIKAFHAREDVDKELVIVPASRVKETPTPCSLVIVVHQDMITAVWPMKGGTAKKFDKGLGGPDLTKVGEGLAKEVKACDSTVAFIGAWPDLNWEEVHGVVATLLKSDADKKVKQVVLIEKMPENGKELKL